MFNANEDKPRPNLQAAAAFEQMLADATSQSYALNRNALVLMRGAGGVKRFMGKMSLNL